MSPLTKSLLTSLLLIAGMCALGGCGSSEENKGSVFDADDQQHPANWLITGHPAAALADSSVCMECHGDDFSGGISGVACSSCHTNGNPLTVTNCASCHGNPPNGNAAPNRAGAHNTTNGHFAPQVTLPDSCNTCHNGAGTGTAEHFDGIVEVQFLSIYSAKSGTAVFNADNTCSNVSCHGGQTTPNWFSGSINVATQCTSCHSYGTSEYNSFVSGQHDFHVNTLAKPCIACHNTVTLSQIHFISLNTTTVVGAATTIGGGITEVSNYTNGTCLSDCHVPAGPRSWF
ncbi:MAG TPA: CxxxxCH/CxxCH domain-containing protein [Nitrospirota bacterium]|nr:CxxxxCH/CxxCH domain-containing protein [Nitrospirota bacterium]